jgi:hypothetical protein
MTGRHLAWGWRSKKPVEPTARVLEDINEISGHEKSVIGQITLSRGLSN